MRGDVLTRFTTTWHSRFQGTPVKQILRTVFHKALVNDIRLSVGLLHTVILYRKNTPFLINRMNPSLGSFMPMKRTNKLTVYPTDRKAVDRPQAFVSFKLSWNSFI